MTRSAAIVRAAPLDGDYFSPDVVVYFMPTGGPDELGSWLSKRTGIHVKIGGSVGRALNNAGNAVVKAATDTGHVVGKVASNPLVQKATAVGLALVPGVGPVAAAAVLAAEKGGGALLAPGGNIGKAASGAVSGAVEGGALNIAGRALSPLVSRIPGASTVQNVASVLRRAAPQLPTPAPLARIAAAMPGTDVPAPSSGLGPLDVDGNPASYRPAAGTSIGNPFGLPKIKPPAAPAPTSTNRGKGPMAYDILAHLLGTDRAKKLTGAADAVTSATQPVATLVQRVAAPKLPPVPAGLTDAADAVNRAPVPGANLPDVPSPADYANGMVQRQGAPTSGDPLALVKEHPVAAAAAVGVVAWLAFGRR